MLAITASFPVYLKVPLFSGNQLAKQNFHLRVSPLASEYGRASQKLRDNSLVTNMGSNPSAGIS
jgi:hypothetical protein